MKYDQKGALWVYISIFGKATWWYCMSFAALYGWVGDHP